MEYTVIYIISVPNDFQSLKLINLHDTVQQLESSLYVIEYKTLIDPYYEVVLPIDKLMSYVRALNNIIQVDGERLSHKQNSLFIRYFQ